MQDFSTRLQQFFDSIEFDFNDKYTGNKYFYMNIQHCILLWGASDHKEFFLTFFSALRRLDQFDDIGFGEYEVCKVEHSYNRRDCYKQVERLANAVFEDWYQESVPRNFQKKCQELEAL